MTLVVKQPLSNLFDMSSNVREWCGDWYGDYDSGAQNNPTGPASGSYRVLCGGSWKYDAALARVADRYIYNPDYRFYNIGFRLACSTN